MSLHPEVQPEKPLFPLGMLMITMPALRTISDPDIRAALGRHMRGDWGEVDVEDKRANDGALKNGTRLFSAYTSSKGQRFWLITEADRSQTTVLLPDDY